MNSSFSRKYKWGVVSEDQRSKAGVPVAGVERDASGAERKWSVRQGVVPGARDGRSYLFLPAPEAPAGSLRSAGTGTAIAVGRGSAAGLSFPRNGVPHNVLANRIPGAVELTGDPTDTPVFLLVKYADLLVLIHLYNHLSVLLLVTF